MTQPQKRDPEAIEAAIDAAREANRGWHSDVGPHDYIVPFLRSLGLDELADAVQADKEQRF